MAEVRQRSIRLDVPIDDRVVAYASRTRRSVNAAVNFLLGEALDREDSEASQVPVASSAGQSWGTSTVIEGGAAGAGDR